MPPPKELPGAPGAEASREVARARVTTLTASPTGPSICGIGGDCVFVRVRVPPERYKPPPYPVPPKPPLPPTPAVLTAVPPPLEVPECATGTCDYPAPTKHDGERPRAAQSAGAALATLSDIGIQGIGE